jgi:pimeloyl-ACP methyl ester carboxylesterase
MPRARANGIELEYDTRGDPAGPPLLLVMGLGGQLIAWDDAFCDLLADEGFWVVRYDNRDVGLSTKFEATPDFSALLSGDRSSVPYLLADMAEDAAGLLDALDVSAAHVVGVSMGGMIAQNLAIAHPDRVLTLTSIMSTTGDPAVGAPHPEALSVLLSRPPSGREAVIEHDLTNTRVIASPGVPFDEERERRRATASYDRCFCPEGTARQFAAILASPDRTASLRQLGVQTLVVHGADDPLIDASGGRATAAAIPGAALVVIPGMGHDLPVPLWPDLVAHISAHVRAHASSGERL